MGQFVTENQTPYVMEPLALANEELFPLLAVVVKGTWSFAKGALVLAPEQRPILVAGEHYGEPETSSYRYEPECAFIKPATDVVLLGHAHPPDARTAELLVDLRVGALRKTVKVVGERRWFKSLGEISATKPKALDPVPLLWERAFGGWDRTDPDEAKHRYEARNPVGVGFHASSRAYKEGLPLPSLEDPREPLRSFTSPVTPAGFGFICPHWQPRAALGGTYDDDWVVHQAPQLPRDFDRRFFNGAAPGLVAEGYLRGDEKVVIENASARGALRFALPGVPTPSVVVELAGQDDVALEMRLDTVILDTDADELQLLWRGHVLLPADLHDVRTIAVGGAPLQDATG